MKFDTRCIPKFLNDSEIEIIERCVKENVTDTYVETRFQHVTASDNILLYAPQFRPVRNILEPKLQAEFGTDLKMPNVHILNAYEPYGIHSDVMSANFDPAGPDLAAWTFIIPLADYDSHTIVFEQSHEWIKTVEPWVQAVNPPTHEIDYEFHEKYMDHCPANDLSWLSVQTVFPWRRGDLCAADRRRFHVSDNFLKNGVTCKRAIIVWSTVPKSANWQS